MSRSRRLIVTCPACETRLRLGGTEGLPRRFKVRCSSCDTAFVGRLPSPAGPEKGAPGQEPPNRELPASETLRGRATLSPAADPSSPESRSSADSPSETRDPPGTVSPAPRGKGSTESLEGATSVLPSTSAGSGGERITTFSPGEWVGERYRIERFVAMGGMGEVYEARDTALEQRVALKVVKPAAVSDAGALERFKREIHVARQVTHRNVCRIYDLGIHRSEGPLARLYPDGKIPFVSMELLEGESLADRLRRTGAMSLEEARPLVEQMAAALEEAHQAGIVHRDFKPANVMLVPTEGGERAVVTDFGLARRHGRDSGQTLTQSGSVMGSPAYMAPEQVQGGAVTEAADLYALGVVLYEMATGSVPFQGESPIATAAKRLSDPPLPPSDLRGDLDPGWEETILRCLHRDPGERFDSATEVARALRGDREVAEEAGRRRMLLAIAAGFLVALAVGLNIWAWRGRAERAANPYLGIEVTERPSVAILGLQNLTGRQRVEWLGTGVAEMLGTELSGGGAVRVVSREDVARVRREMGLEGGEEVTGPAPTELLKRLGAEYLVSGSYTVVGEGTDAQLRLDLELRSRDLRGNARGVAVRGRERELFELISRAGDELREALEVEVRRTEEAFRWASREAARSYATAVDRLEVNDFEGAREKLETAAEIEPGNPRIRAALAAVYQRLGYEREAEEEIGRAAELADGLPVAERLEIRARSLEYEGRWEEAAGVWDELWRLHPDSVEHGLSLARALLTAGRPDGAEQVLEALERLEVGTQDPRIFFTRASVAAARGDFRRQQEAAARAGSLAEAREARLLLAEARLVEGWAWRNLGRASRARERTREARTLYEEMGDPAGEARARVQEATLLFDQGNLDEARTAFEETLSTYRALGDRGQEARVLNNLAVVLRQQGEPDRALELYDRVLSLARETGSRIGVAQAQSNLGVLRLKRGDLAEAHRRFRETLTIAREIGDRRQEAHALYDLALVLRRQGQLGEARERQEEALAIRREMGQRVGEAASLSDLATLALYEGHLEEAESRYREALEIARDAENPRLGAFARYGLAQVYFERDERQGAEAFHSEALTIRRDLGEGATVAESQLALARLELEWGNAVAALARLDSAIPSLRGESARDALLRARALRARALAMEGRSEEALSEIGDLDGRLEESEDLTASLRAGLDLARAEIRLDRRESSLARAREVASRAREAGLIPLALEGQLLVGKRTRDPLRARNLRGEVRTEATAMGFERLARSAR